jgi:tetratricopeptide (TPR) repeat protein
MPLKIRQKMPIMHSPDSHGRRGPQQRSVKLENPQASELRNIPHTSFISMALFEQGRTYVRTSQYNNAEEIFRTILAFQEHSAYHAKALVELGLIRINMQQPDQALEFYKEVMQRFPRFSRCSQRPGSIENVYMAKMIPKAFSTI